MVIIDMHKFLILAAALNIFVGCSCSRNSDDVSKHSSSSDSSEYSDKENPYEEGSGHSAGYEWAQEHEVESCGGNSESFREGCEEYQNQKSSEESEE